MNNKEKYRDFMRIDEKFMDTEMHVLGRWLRHFEPGDVKRIGIIEDHSEALMRTTQWNLENKRSRRIAKNNKEHTLALSRRKMIFQKSKL